MQTLLSPSTTCVYGRVSKESVIKDGLNTLTVAEASVETSCLSAEKVQDSCRLSYRVLGYWVSYQHPPHTTEHCPSSSLMCTNADAFVVVRTQKRHTRADTCAGTQTEGETCSSTCSQSGGSCQADVTPRTLNARARRRRSTTGNCCSAQTRLTG